MKYLLFTSMMIVGTCSMAISNEKEHDNCFQNNLSGTGVNNIQNTHINFVRTKYLPENLERKRKKRKTKYNTRKRKRSDNPRSQRANTNNQQNNTQADNISVENDTMLNKENLYNGVAQRRQKRQRTARTWDDNATKTTSTDFKVKNLLLTDDSETLEIPLSFKNNKIIKYKQINNQQADDSLEKKTQEILKKCFAEKYCENYRKKMIQLVQTAHELYSPASAKYNPKAFREELDKIFPNTEQGSTYAKFSNDKTLDALIYITLNSHLYSSFLGIVKKRSK